MNIARVWILAFAFTPLLSRGQTPATTPSALPEKPKVNTQGAATTGGASGTTSGAGTPGSTDDKTEQAIETALDQYNKNQTKDPDFELSLGIGSLIVASGASDYTNQSNVLNTTNLGRSTPQYLIGASFRSPFPNFRTRIEDDCREGSTSKPATGETPCWQQRPWKGFVNLKFSSSASQTLNGYVLGGSYQLLHYMDILVGFGFTPFNEASPGFRVTASQYVTAQQKLGNLLNFNPTAMFNGSKNAFDGFPITDSNGALIYKGNPLEVHYRGGVVVGVALPISLKTAFH